MRTREEQIAALKTEMTNHTLLYIQGDDGNGYPLVDALTPDGKSIDYGESECGELAASLYDNIVQPLILEAERRAEQRVRAEIGRDSERLDWFEENCSGAKSQWDDRRSVVEWQVTYGEWGPTIRDAIDTARVRGVKV